MTSKVTKGHLSFREFEKIPSNTFIYESILIKIYMNILISKTSKVIKGHLSFREFKKILTNTFVYFMSLKFTKGHFYV